MSWIKTIAYTTIGTMYLIFYTYFARTEIVPNKGLLVSGIVGFVSCLGYLLIIYAFIDKDQVKGENNE